MSHIDPTYVQILAALLFALGLATAASRRNLFFLLMGVELMLNAVNLSFVGFSRTLGGTASMVGHLVPLFTIAIAAAGCADSFVSCSIVFSLEMIPLGS